MPIISKEAAQRHLDMWMEAEEKGRGRNRIYHFSPHDV